MCIRKASSEERLKANLDKSYNGFRSAGQLIVHNNNNNADIVGIIK